MKNRSAYFLLLGCLIGASLCKPACAERPVLLVSESASGEDPGNRILKYSAIDGRFLGVLVADVSGLNRPQGMLVHPARRTLLVASAATNNIQEFDMDSGEKVREFGSEELRWPMNLRVHPTRETLLVVGRGNRSVLEFDLTTGDFVGTFASSYHISWAFDIDFDLNRKTMLMANYDSIDEFDLETGAFIRTLTRESDNSTSILVHPVSGHLLADTDHAILEFNASSGKLLKTFAKHPDLNYPSDIIWNDVLKDVLVTSRGNQQNIYSFDGMTGDFEKIFVPRGSGGLRAPSRMLVITEPSRLRRVC